MVNNTHSEQCSRCYSWQSYTHSLTGVGSQCVSCGEELWATSRDRALWNEFEMKVEGIIEPIDMSKWLEEMTIKLGFDLVDIRGTFETLLNKFLDNPSEKVSKKVHYMFALQIKVSQKLYNEFQKLGAVELRDERIHSFTPHTWTIPLYERITFNPQNPNPGTSQLEHSTWLPDQSHPYEGGSRNLGSHSNENSYFSEFSSGWSSSTVYSDPSYQGNAPTDYVIQDLGVPASQYEVVTSPRFGEMYCSPDESLVFQETPFDIPPELSNFETVPAVPQATENQDLEVIEEDNYELPVTSESTDQWTKLHGKTLWEAFTKRADRSWESIYMKQFFEDMAQVMNFESKLIEEKFREEHDKFMKNPASGVDKKVKYTFVADFCTPSLDPITITSYNPSVINKQRQLTAPIRRSQRLQTQPQIKEVTVFEAETATQVESPNQVNIQLTTPVRRSQRLQTQPQIKEVVVFEAERSAQVEMQNQVVTQPAILVRRSPRLRKETLLEEVIVLEKFSQATNQDERIYEADDTTLEEGTSSQWERQNEVVVQPALPKRRTQSLQNHNQNEEMVVLEASSLATSQDKRTAEVLKPPEKSATEAADQLEPIPLTLSNRTESEIDENEDLYEYFFEPQQDDPPENSEPPVSVETRCPSMPSPANQMNQPKRAIVVNENYPSPVKKERKNPEPYVSLKFQNSFCSRNAILPQPKASVYMFIYLIRNCLIGVNDPKIEESLKRAARFMEKNMVELQRKTIDDHNLFHQLKVIYSIVRNQSSTPNTEIYVIEKTLSLSNFLKKLHVVVMQLKTFSPQLADLGIEISSKMKELSGEETFPANQLTVLIGFVFGTHLKMF